MLSAALLLFANSLLLSLRLSGGGSFPKPLTSVQEKECLARLAGGDMEARNTLIEHNLRLVAHIIKKYYTQSADQEDLISIGTIGLIKGITSFDPDKGARLATYAARCVENAILSQRLKVILLKNGDWHGIAGRRQLHWLSRAGADKKALRRAKNPIKGEPQGVECTIRAMKKRETGWRFPPRSSRTLCFPTLSARIIFSVLLNRTDQRKFLSSWAGQPPDKLGNRFRMDDSDPPGKFLPALRSCRTMNDQIHAPLSLSYLSPHDMDGTEAVDRKQGGSLENTCEAAGRSSPEIFI